MAVDTKFSLKIFTEAVGIDFLRLADTPYIRVTAGL
jgi:hypothetical protein